MQRDQRRLAAIVSADVAGYSRLMEADESGTLAALKRHREELIDPKVRRYGGRVVGTAGDSLLIEFGSVVDAVQCAAEVQQGMTERNAGLPAERHMRLRIGVNLGDVIVDGTDIHGDGVNVAARLEKLAEPGGICVSGVVHDQVAGKVPFSFFAMGEQSFKNIARPVRVLRLELAPTARPPTTEAARPPDKPSIAVLPLTNMSGDPEQEYFSDGITEDIITELSRFKSLYVIARNSSFRYKGQSPKVQDVGRELGVRYVVEGSVRKAGNRVRVTAQLVETETGNHIWAERYDRALDDIFAVQDELVRAVASAIPERLDRTELDRSQLKKPENMSAYDHVLRGRFLTWRSSSDKREVLAHFLKALELEPNYAAAHVGTASMYAYGIYVLGIPPGEALSKARHHVERALALDDDNAQTHATAALTYILCGEHDLARIHSERAIALNPNDLTAIGVRGVVLTYWGEAGSALDYLRLSERLQAYAPDDTRLEPLFDCCFMLGDYEEAVATFRRWRVAEAHMHAELAAALAQLGRLDEARVARAAYLERLPAGRDPDEFPRNQARMCRRPEDAERWLEGFRKAGFEV